MKGLGCVTGLQSTEGKEAARLVLDEEGEVFTGCQGHILLREVLFAEPSLSKSDHVFSLLRGVNDSRVLLVNVNFSSAAHRLSGQCRNFLDALLHLLQGRVVVAANSSLHERRVREDVEGVARLKVANRENEVLCAVNIAGLDRVQSLENLVSAGDWVVKFVRSRTVTTLAEDLDFNDSDSSKESAFADPNVAFIEVGNVMEAVDLVDSLQAAFLDHRRGTTGALFSRLEKKSHSFADRHLIATLSKNLCSCKKDRHVSIVTTHVSMICLRSVWKIRAVFGNWKSIHVGSQCHHGNWTIFRLGSLSSSLRSAQQINNKTSPRTVLDELVLDAVALQGVAQKFLSSKLFEAAFRMRVQDLPHANSFIDITACLLHDLLVLSVVLCEVSFTRTGEWTFFLGLLAGSSDGLLALLR